MYKTRESSTEQSNSHEGFQDTQEFGRRRKFFSVKVTDDLFLKVFVFVIFGSLSVWFVFC